jgi:predicted TIM-barrel fold metal-dependent hydrolase
MLDLDIVDAHHHLWDLSMSYPWLQSSAGELSVHGDDRAIRRNYLVPDYLEDAEPLRVRASVHIDAGAGDPVAEASWLQRVSDQNGYPHGIVAGVELDEPTVAETLETLSALPNLRGVRHILNWHPDPGLSYTDRPDIITDPAWLSGFARLSELRLSFDLQVYPSQLLQSARLAADHPDTLIVLNHAGMPVDRDADQLRLWRDGLRALAAQPNTAAKISGIGMTDHQWTVDSIRPIVLETIEAFGADRSMFASNFPVDSLYSSFQDLYAAFDAITADFSTTERRLLFADTARRVYRLGD